MALLEKTLGEAVKEYELRIPMTYEQFLAELAEDTHAEWVDGETILFMPPNPDHQRVVSFLIAIIRFYVDLFQLGEILPAPIEMKPTPASNAREPDILFVAAENVNRIGRTKLEGVADLVIEVVSPESAKRDTVEKRDEYEAEGVREYWIIDIRPGQETAIFYVLNESGRFEAVKPNDEGIYHSSVLTNFWLNINWFWAKPQPRVPAVIAQIVGPDALSR